MTSFCKIKIGGTGTVNGEFIVIKQNLEMLFIDLWILSQKYSLPYAEC